MLESTDIFLFSPTLPWTVWRRFGTELMLEQDALPPMTEWLRVGALYTVLAVSEDARLSSAHDLKKRCSRASSGEIRFSEGSQCCVNNFAQ